MERKLAGNCFICDNTNRENYAGKECGAAATEMTGMFADCYTLEELDPSGFDTAQSDMDYMFANCYSLRAVMTGDGWVTDAERGEETLFYGCGKTAEEIIREERGAEAFPPSHAFRSRSRRSEKTSTARLIFSSE